MGARRIMVPLDGSAMAEAALPVAEGLATGAETTFFLVRAAEAPDDLADITAARWDAVEVAKSYLETVATALKGHGFEKVEIVTLYGPAPGAILEAARAHEPDLIVMATSGRRGVRRLMFGSVAETVVRGTQVPVFLVRAGDESKPGAPRRAVSAWRERAHV
jgi:nucleotide-binding universal stress UspA family protein